MGISPRQSRSTFCASVSTQATDGPNSAKHAPDTRPTYPVPTIAIFMKDSVAHAVVLAIPCDETLHAQLDGRLRRKPHVLHQRLDVRVCRGHIPWLNRQHTLLGNAAECLLDRADEMHQLDRIVVADVVQAIWRLAGRR